MFSNVCVLALLAFVGIASAADSTLSNSTTNAERIKRGAPVKRPARLFDPSRTRPPPSKRSAAAALPTIFVAFQPANPTPDRRRAVNTYYAAVTDGFLQLVEDVALASTFLQPDYSSGAAALTWIPGVSGGDFTAGSLYKMFAAMKQDVYSLQFATTPDGPTDILAAPSPAYPNTLNPRPAGQPFLWIVNGDLEMYLASDLATAMSEIDGAVAMLAAPVTPGSEPNFEDARAAQDGVGMANLYVWKEDGTGGFVVVGGDGHLMGISSADTATKFYFPDSANGANTQTLATADDGTLLVVSLDQDDGTLAILGAYPPSNSIITATFTGPNLPSASGIIGVYDGASTWSTYSTTDDTTIYTCPDPNSCLSAGTVQRVCLELVPLGATFSACADANRQPIITPELAVGYLGGFTGLGDGSVLIGNYDGYTERGQCDNGCIQGNYTWSWWLQGSTSPICYCSDIGPSPKFADSSDQLNKYVARSLNTTFQWQECYDGFDSSITAPIITGGNTPDTCFDVCEGYPFTMLYASYIDTIDYNGQWGCYCFDADPSAAFNTPSTCKVNGFFLYKQQ